MNLATPYSTTRYGNRPIASPYGRAYWRGWDFAITGHMGYVESSLLRRRAFWNGYDMARASLGHYVPR